MEVRALLDVLHIAERLKDELRHCETSRGRRESVAEHSWRLALMAFFMKDEFPALDMDKVIKMCLIHDLGECFTGDIPTFFEVCKRRKEGGYRAVRLGRVAPGPVQYGAGRAVYRNGRAADRRSEAL